MKLIELHCANAVYCLNVDYIICIRPDQITGGCVICVVDIEQPIFASEGYEEVLQMVRRSDNGN